MSRINSIYVEKTQQMIAGMERNVKLIRDKGLDELFISRLKSENELAATYNKEYEKLKAEFKAKVAQTNEKLREVKKQVQSAKKVIKRDFDKSKWKEFGISDLR